MLYTTSINCTTNADQAYNQMRLVYEQYVRYKFSSPLPLEGKGTVKAIHYIMSFADSENVTPELAHKIAKAFVRKNFGEDAQVVIATHVDRSHCPCPHHSELIFAFRAEILCLPQLSAAGKGERQRCMPGVWCHPCAEFRE